MKTYFASFPCGYMFILLRLNLEKRAVVLETYEHAISVLCNALWMWRFKV